MSRYQMFGKWAVVGPNDDTGVGRMALDIREVLGLGRHLVFPSERFFTRALRDGLDVGVTRADGPERLEAALAGLKGIIIIEHSWNKLLIPTAWRLGIKVVVVPMWEWFDQNSPDWKLCDAFFCPTQFTARVLKSLGYSRTRVVTWALDLRRLPTREAKSGPARKFIHNAGWVDEDDRKGTLDTIRAFERLKHPGLQLIVRAQAKVPLLTSDPRIELRVGNAATPGELYAEGDVAIQPSKMEGLGFMVLEPVCCGLPVITTDYPPMNEFVREPEMLVRLRWWRRRAFATQWIKQAHLRLPSGSDLSKRIAWCAASDIGPIASANLQWAQRQFDAARLRVEWAEALQSLG